MSETDVIQQELEIEPAIQVAPADEDAPVKVEKAVAND